MINKEQVGKYMINNDLDSTFKNLDKVMYS